MGLVAILNTVVLTVSVLSCGSYYVWLNIYLLGNLALSRALGDFEFKKNYSLVAEKQIITADPDVTCHEVTDDDEFLIIACDGSTP